MLPAALIDYSRTPIVTIAPVLQHACLLHHFSDYPNMARACAEQLLGLARTTCFPF
jgi:hypothetical protein